MEFCLLLLSNSNAVVSCYSMVREKIVCSCIKVNEELLLAVGTSCPLQSLSIKRCKGVTNAALTAVCENCKNLLALAIDDNPKLTEVSMACIAKHCVRLEVITVYKRKASQVEDIVC